MKQIFCKKKNGYVIFILSYSLKTFNILHLTHLNPLLFVGSTNFRFETILH